MLPARAKDHPCSSVPPLFGYELHILHNSHLQRQAAAALIYSFSCSVHAVISAAEALALMLLAAGCVHSQDDLNLCLDDQRVSHCEPIQHFAQLHELLPAPIMLLLAEPVQCVCDGRILRTQRTHV